MVSTRAFVEELLKKANVHIGGSLMQDIIVHDERFFNRVLRYGTLGLGESYMDGWWDTSALDQFMARLLLAKLHDKIRPNVELLWMYLKARFLNLQSPSRVTQVAKVHYDLGNDLYSAMLDKRMVYTCGYWSGNPPAGGLDEAQESKLDLVCRKIGLKKGDRILDIGCGWGSFAKFAAEKYSASVVGITISVEQATLAKERCNGLPIEIRVQDYREVHEKFDHIVSLGMFEHVGDKNYRDYFKMARRCLKDDGLFLLHTIGNDFSAHESDAWINKYIFPNGMLPSIAQIGEATESLFIMEDWHNFGPDYDKTLMAWFKNFDAAWPALRGKYASPGEDSEHKGDRFYRMWKYYLLSCAASARSRHIQLWQIVLSPTGVRGGYTSIR